MIVADTNLLVYLCTESADSALADAVWRRDAAWAAPLLWRSEFRNVLVTLIRGRRLALDEALRSMAAAERVVAGREYSVASDDVVRLATDSGCSAYDCEYVVLARGLGVPFVTSDGAVLKAFPDIAARPRAFAG